MRDLCAIEMIARVSKRIVAEKLRRAIYHFRDVEANNIEEEIKSYAVRLMNQILGAPEQQRKVDLGDGMSGPPADIPSL